MAENGTRDGKSRIRRLNVHQHRGQPVHPHSISQTFERIANRAGVPRIRLHDIRQTHRTLLISAGVPVRVVSERLGHGNPAFTIDTYQHVNPGRQAETARTFETLIKEARRETPVERPVEEPHNTVRALAIGPLARAFGSGTLGNRCQLVPPRVSLC
ncbi:MAG: tyrosine-type recombinase/integrase [Actinomycetota bacterium]